MRAQLLTSLFIFLAPLVSSAEYLHSKDFATQLRFGSEMTLSSDELLKSYPSNGNEVRVSTSFADSLLKSLKDAIQTKYRGKVGAPVIEEQSYHSKWNRYAFSLQYPNDFKLTVFPDPGALEINSSPSTLKDIEDNQSRIQSDIFDEAKKLGLEPAAFTGSGHMHIEVAKLHPVTARNFIADFFNHTGLAAGALNEDVFNAIGVGEIPEANKQYLRDSFKHFDSLEAPKYTDLGAIGERGYQISRKADLPEYQRARNSTRATKYFAVSFRSLSSIGTIEIRSIRPQASAGSYLKLVKLFTLRMQHAEKLRLQGKRVELGAMKSVRGQPLEIIADFDRYVSEVGLDINDYREFVLPWWQHKGAQFDQHLSLKRSHSARSCRAIF